MKILVLSKKVRFLMSLGAGAIVWVAVFQSLTYFLGLGHIYSVTIAFLISEAVSFIFKRVWVFKDKNNKKKTFQLFFCFLLAFTYTLTNAGFLCLLVEHWHQEFYASQILVIIILFVPNYLLTNKIFIVQKIQ